MSQSIVDEMNDIEEELAYDVNDEDDWMDFWMFQSTDYHE
jgi:hypothetical protein